MNQSAKKILVTGGAGYIGSHTVVSLVEKGYTPIIVDDFRNSNRETIQRLSAIIGFNPDCHAIDCQDEIALSKLFEKHDFYGVIHFAADKAVGESVENPLKYFKNNLGGLTSLLSVMQKFNVNRLVFSSSCTVYGEPTVIPVTEDSSLTFSSPYGFTKLANEQMIQQFADSSKNFKSILLRYFNPVGAHTSGLLGEEPQGIPNNLLPFITQTAIGERKCLKVFGNDYDTVDGTCIRDYIHVEDLAEAHVKAIDFFDNKKCGKSEVFNIGTGKGTSVMEMIDIFEEVSSLRLDWEFAPRRSGDIPAIFARVDKANSVLGWQAKRTVKDAVKSAWNFELKKRDQQ